MRSLLSDITIEISFFNWVPAIPIFILSMVTFVSVSSKTSRYIRKVADIVYIIHPWIITICGWIGLNYMERGLTAAVVSLFVSTAILFLFQRRKGKK